MSALPGALAAAGTVAALAGATGITSRGALRHRPGSGRPPAPRDGGRSRGEVARGGAGGAPGPTAGAGEVVARSSPPSRLVVPVVLLVVAVAAVLGPVVAVVGVVVVGVARLRAARASRRRRLRALESSVPDLVDLFVIAAAAGHPVAACLVMVAERAPGPLRPVLADACASVARGMPLADALGALGGRLGVLGPALCGAMATSAATGAPLGPALRDVAAIARDRRRRDAENEARRLPITLLFPLVCCVLPAFVLLAVVPLLAASLRALEI